MACLYVFGSESEVSSVATINMSAILEGGTPLFSRMLRLAAAGGGLAGADVVATLSRMQELDCLSSVRWQDRFSVCMDIFLW